jgi:glycogen synthase
MKQMLSFSIVINTLNRASLLQKTLESFRWIKYAGDFEVIVVNGPSTDNSDEVIAAWQPMIRAGNCDVANLSVSRNIAICMAQGDIVAFIDDDAIPEPEWLAQLAEAYKDPGVGAVGGLVYNHTGYDFQYQYCLVDRLGNADLSLPGPTPHLSFPKSYRFPHLLGCNSSFRRSALLEVGGFDEEYEYFLDETDVCLRIVDAGYVISQLPNAYVHHKYAPSNIRGENRVPKYRYPVIKNKIYFMLKHGREFHPIDYVIGEQQTFIQNQRKEIDWAIGRDFFPPAIWRYSTRM